jgi:hypothetical protein
MNELLRLEYLEAMGITQYVARAPLPGALPSTIFNIEYAEEIFEAAISSEKNERPGRITALFDDHQSDGNQPKDKKTIEETAKISSGSKTESATATPTLAVAHQCQIAIWTIGELLIIADAPRLENKHLTLLRNILQAIGIQDNLPDVKQFHWPLPQRRDKSLLAAREHFQGMLDGGPLKQPGLRQILCFGNAANTLLIHDDSPHANSQQRYMDWPIINACSLHDMLADPLRKADTWRALQVLVRH